MLRGMRKTKMTAEEIFEAEKAVEERKQSRKSGFGLMKKRDRGVAVIKNHRGGIVRVMWPVANPVQMVTTSEGTPFYFSLPEEYVPEGMFKIMVGEETALVDAEELRKALRWA